MKGFLGCIILLLIQHIAAAQSNNNGVPFSESITSYTKQTIQVLDATDKKYKRKEINVFDVKGRPLSKTKLTWREETGLPRASYAKTEANALKETTLYSYSEESDAQFGKIYKQKIVEEGSLEKSNIYVSLDSVKGSVRFKQFEEELKSGSYTSLLMSGSTFSTDTKRYFNNIGNIDYESVESEFSEKDGSIKTQKEEKSNNWIDKYTLKESLVESEEEFINPSRSGKSFSHRYTNNIFDKAGKQVESVEEIKNYFVENNKVDSTYEKIITKITFENEVKVETSSNKKGTEITIKKFDKAENQIYEKITISSTSAILSEDKWVYEKNLLVAHTFERKDNIMPVTYYYSYDSWKNPLQVVLVDEIGNRFIIKSYSYE